MSNTDLLPLKIVQKDDHLPMHVEKASERDAVLDLVWLSSSESSEIVLCVFEQLFANCVIDVILKERPASELPMVANLLFVLPRCKLKSVKYS
jgi:hypothetical protein